MDWRVTCCRVLFNMIDQTPWTIRLDSEKRKLEVRETRKRLRQDTDNKPLQNFEDIYGFRGKDPAVFLLSPWEFLMHWECVPYGFLGTVLAEEEGRFLMFPTLSEGTLQLNKYWYMRRRMVPMVPSPSSTPMPDSKQDVEDKAKLYSVYLRPWVLDKNLATREVPHISDLDVLPDTVPLRKRVRGKSTGTPGATRSYELSWRWYIRGHVVSQHAARLIVQFMAACCGKSTSDLSRDVENDKVIDTRLSLPASISI